MIERTVNAERMEHIIEVFGSFDENIKKIENAFDIHVINRGTELKIQGDEEMADHGVRAVEGLIALAAKGETIDEQKVRYLIDLVRSGNGIRSAPWRRMLSVLQPRESQSRPRHWANRST